MRYDESANGQQIESRVGEEFEIALPEVPAAGYQWTTIQTGGPCCKLLDEKKDQASLLGGSRTHHWKMRGIAAGTGEIELQYGRDWEKTGPTKRFQLTVVVRP